MSEIAYIETSVPGYDPDYERKMEILMRAQLASPTYFDAGALIMVPNVTIDSVPTGEQAANAERKPTDAELITSALLKGTIKDAGREDFRDINPEVLAKYNRAYMLLSLVAMGMPGFDSEHIASQGNYDIVNKMFSDRLYISGKPFNTAISELRLGTLSMVAFHNRIACLSEVQLSGIKGQLAEQPIMGYGLLKAIAYGLTVTTDSLQKKRFEEWIDILALDQQTASEPLLNGVVTRLDTGEFDPFIVADSMLAIEKGTDDTDQLIANLRKHRQLVANIAQHCGQEPTDLLVDGLVLSELDTMPRGAADEVVNLRRTLQTAYMRSLGASSKRLRDYGYTVPVEQREAELSRRLRSILLGKDGVFTKAVDQGAFVLRVISMDERASVDAASAARRQAALEREVAERHHGISEFAFNMHGQPVEVLIDDMLQVKHRELALTGANATQFAGKVLRCLSGLAAYDSFDGVRGIGKVHPGYDNFYYLVAPEAKGAAFSMAGKSNHWLRTGRILFARNPRTEEIGLVDVVHRDEVADWVKNH